MARLPAQDQASGRNRLVGTEVDEERPARGQAGELMPVQAGRHDAEVGVPETAAKRVIDTDDDRPGTTQSELDRQRFAGECGNAQADTGQTRSPERVLFNANLREQRLGKVEK